VRVISGTSALTYHPIKCKTINEHGRKTDKQTARKIVQQMIRISVKILYSVGD
jgi:hypothetical protein